eukprot:c20651_g1_i1 orf=91-1014(-)
MDCLPARGTLPLSGLQASNRHNQHNQHHWQVMHARYHHNQHRWQARRVGSHTSRRLDTKTLCCSTFPSEAAVFTASRLSTSVLRIIGPGSNFITSGLGSLLAVDEFFVHPYHQQQNSVGPYQAKSLTYFLEENLEHDVTEGRESKSVRHGIEVLFETCKKGGADGYAESKCMNLLPLSAQVREAASVETLFLESGDGKGGAKVRVVAGQYDTVLTSVQENFVLLDVLMRPGSVAKIPVHPSHGLIIYILEGVGIFNRDASCRPFYENEGHGIWFPPLSDDKISGKLLHVQCHLCSSLRVLVLEVALT